MRFGWVSRIRVSFGRGTPIVDPGSGEVIGYELEEVERIRVAVG